MGAVTGYLLDRPRCRLAGVVLVAAVRSDPRYRGCWYRRLSPPLLTVVSTPVGAALHLWYHHPRSDPPVAVEAVAVLKRHLHRYQYRRGLVQSILRPVLLLSVCAIISRK